MSLALMRPLVAALLVAGFLPAGVAHGAPKCSQGEPEFAYDADDISYSIRLDLRRCSWLKRKPFLIQGSLTRDTGAGSGGQAVTAFCSRKRVCRITLQMDHLPAEAARYHGEISYTWRKKFVAHTVGKVCVSAAVAGECADL